MRAFIWDLDGTLLDSYEIILDSTSQVLDEAGISMARSDIYKRLIDSSVHALLLKAAEETGIEHGRLLARYWEINNRRDSEIQLMRHAADTLERLSSRGDISFVYTHKGESASAVLECLGVLRYFTEVVTNKYGFARKPSPEGIDYLIKKYGLDREKTYYVGDRRIDVECAGNAGVKSILYLDPSSPVTALGDEDFVVRGLELIPDAVI